MNPEYNPFDKSKESIAFESNIDREDARALLHRAEELCAGEPNILVMLPDGNLAVIGYRLDDHPIPNPRESELTIDVLGGLRWRVFKNYDEFMLTVTESLGREGQRLASSLETQQLGDNLAGAVPKSPFADGNQT